MADGGSGEEKKERSEERAEFAGQNCLNLGQNYLFFFVNGQNYSISYRMYNDGMSHEMVYLSPPIN